MAEELMNSMKNEAWSHVLKLALKGFSCASMGLLILGTADAVGRSNVGVFMTGEEGFNTKTYYYDDGQEVVLFDTQFLPSMTEEMLETVKKKTSSPITTVIVTHANPDKFNGLGFLHSLGVKSMTSRAVASEIPESHRYKEQFWVKKMKTFQPGSYPELSPVQQVFDGESKTLTLKSGKTLTLFALKHGGVANSQVVVRIDETGDLIVGDLVHHGAHAWLEGGVKDGKVMPSPEAWKESLNELLVLSEGHPNAKVFGGRGDAALVNVAIKQQKAYLTKVSSIARDYYLSPENCRKSQGENSEKEDVDAIKKSIVKNFPSYRYPYMLDYSLYGLLRRVKKETCQKALDDQVEKKTVTDRVELSRTYNVPSRTLWGKLKNFCSIADWQSLVKACGTATTNEGTKRAILMKDGTVYIESLRDLSEDSKNFTYSIDQGPISVHGYVSTMKVNSESENRSRLVWRSSYRVREEDRIDLKKNLISLYRNGLNGIEMMLMAR